jgi:hypothetical protein
MMVTGKNDAGKQTVNSSKNASRSNLKSWQEAWRRWTIGAVNSLMTRGLII